MEVGSRLRGEVPEWLIGPVSKTGVPSGTAGSNPALSVFVSTDAYNVIFILYPRSKKSE